MPRIGIDAENRDELHWLHGNESDFTRLYRHYHPILYGIAFSYLKSKDRAGDAVQDVFLQLWNKRQDIHTHPLSSYLFSMIRNRCIDIRRTERIVAPVDELVNRDTGAGPGEELEARQTGRLLRDLILELSPQCRTVFVLVRFHKLKYREVAELMSISQKTVENHMGRAIRALREGIDEAGNPANAQLLLFIFISDFQGSMDFYHSALGVWV